MRQNLRRISFTPTLSTDAYASGDVLFDTMAVLGAVEFETGLSWIRAITMRDKADQGSIISLIFFRANVSLGTINDPPAISDANADYVTGGVAIQEANYTDLGGVRIGYVDDVIVPIEGADGTKTIYVAAIVTGTPTYAASSLTFDLWVEAL